MTTPVITRRGLIQVGAALAASGIAVRKAGAFGRVPGIKLDVMVVDDSDDGRVFGRAAAGQGMRVCAASDELGIYYLASSWRREAPMPLGGLTHAANLFVVERLAWDVGMRVVFLGRHSNLDGDLAHALKGPPAAINRFHTSARLSDWRIALARTLMDLPHLTPALKPLHAVRDVMIEGDLALFSWVIAPVARPRRVLA
jgi:hypothetical protein